MQRSPLEQQTLFSFVQWAKHGCSQEYKQIVLWERNGTLKTAGKCLIVCPASLRWALSTQQSQPSCHLAFSCWFLSKAIAGLLRKAGPKALGKLARSSQCSTVRGRALGCSNLFLLKANSSLWTIMSFQVCGIHVWAQVCCSSGRWTQGVPVWEVHTASALSFIHWIHFASILLLFPASCAFAWCVRALVCAPHKPKACGWIRTGLNLWMLFSERKSSSFSTEIRKKPEFWNKAGIAGVLQPLQDALSSDQGLGYCRVASSCGVPLSSTFTFLPPDSLLLLVSLNGESFTFPHPETPLCISEGIYLTMIWCGSSWL